MTFRRLVVRRKIQLRGLAKAFEGLIYFNCER